MRIVGQRHDNSFLSLRTVPNAERPTAITTDITVNPGHVVAGLGLDYRVHDAVTIFLRSDNVGDTEYDSALGYPALPARGGVRRAVSSEPRTLMREQVASNGDDDGNVSPLDDGRVDRRYGSRPVAG